MDMTHTVSSYAGLSNLNTTFIADNTLVLNLLILTAVALPVLARTKYSFAEKSVLFWLSAVSVSLLMRMLPHLVIILR